MTLQIHFRCHRCEW